MNTTHQTAVDDRWTTLNIRLHWLIVLLLIVQAIDHEWMNAFFDASVEGSATDTLTSLMGYTHMIAGVTILLAAAVRLWDRFAHGRPPHTSEEPAWAQTTAKVAHVALYTLLLTMPLAGLAAWFTENETVATIHGYAWNALLVLAALHVTGALANHFVFKNAVLRRIMPGQGR